MKNLIVAAVLMFASCANAGESWVYPKDLPYPPTGKKLDYNPEEFIRRYEPRVNDIRRWQIYNGVNIDYPGRFPNRRSREIRCEPPERK